MTATAAPTPRSSTPPPGPRSPSRTTPSPRPTRPTATTRCPPTSRCAPTGRSCRPAAASSVRRATGSPSSTPRHALTPHGHGDQRQRRADRRGQPRPRQQPFTLALGFGTTQHQAVSVAGATLHRSWVSLVASYLSSAGCATTRGSTRRPIRSSPTCPASTAAQSTKAKRAYYVSANVVKSSEDKTFPGAIVASLASPWGQAVSAGDPANTYFGSYREVFARDLYEAWTALYTDGDIATARASVRFLLLKQQQPDGSMPRNSLVNGKLAPGLVQHPARRGGLPDPDGLPVRARQRRRPVAARQGRGQLRRRARAELRPRAVGGAERLLAVDHRGRDRRPGRRRARSPRCTATASTPGSGWRPPTSTSAASRAGRSRRTARCRPTRTSSGSRQTGDPNAAMNYQPRQRRPDARPAIGDRRRVPRAGAPRRALGDRPDRDQLAQGGRRDHRADDPDQHGLAALQRRRVRRLLPAGGAVHRRLHRSPAAPWAPSDKGIGPHLAGPRGRARAAGPSGR